MAGDLASFADKMDALADRLPQAASAAKQEAAVAILRDLAQETPADVGSAISNWQVSLESPELATVSAYAPSPRGRMVNGVWTHTVDPEITREANAPLTIAAGETIIRNAPPGTPIFITNSLPYIGVLDRGSSQQAPAGFVDRAKIIGRLIIDKIKLLA